MKSDQPILYMDHAATSWPKPDPVWGAMEKAMREEGANPGRGGHTMAVRAGKRLMRARMALAELFHVRNPMDIAFMLNTTMALNTALHGFIEAGDHIITTSVEHNSVSRPLESLKIEKNITVTVIETDESGRLDLDVLEKAFTPRTRLVVCNHSSNVLGSILPVDQITKLAHDKGAKVLVDAAQSAGLLPIDVEQMEVDMLAFPGHKGLLGPSGTGGLYIHPELELRPLMQGGTGSHSDSVYHPTTRPDCYEAGTPNTIGIAGLEAGVRFLLHETVENFYTKEWALTQRILCGLQGIKGIRWLGPEIGQARTGIVSFHSEHMDAAACAFRLDREYGIAVRAGYHCSPLAHRTAGTLKEGAVRVSVGWNTTEQQVDDVLEAIEHISKKG